MQANEYEVVLTKGVRAKVATLADASRAVRHDIEVTRGWIGVSEWDRTRNVGAVYRAGVKVAEVSYNGRIWNLDGSEVFA